MSIPPGKTIGYLVQMELHRFFISNILLQTEIVQCGSDSKVELYMI